MRIYPADPLHDGRALGRLQPDEQPARAVRARRGELLRPRREPARRVGAHAGSRRRLLRAAVHDRRLPRAAARHEAGADRRPRVHRGRSSRSTTRCSGCCRSRATRPSTRSTASSATSCGTTAAWRAPSRASSKALAEIPAIREEFWKNVCVLGENESRNQALEKAGRVADFLEFGELLVLDALQRNESLRRPLPRGVPDRGRRGAARRRALRVRRGVGVQGRRHRARAAQGTTRLRVRAPVDPFATSRGSR